MPRERFPPDDPREWLRRARSHLARAKAELPGVYLEDLCGDAQRAAERALKAVFIARRIVFPYVHDLARLRSLLEQAGETVPLSPEDAVGLTTFVARAQHPTDDAPVTAEEHRHLVAVAERVLAWAEEQVAAARAEEGDVARSDPMDEVRRGKVEARDGAGLNELGGTVIAAEGAENEVLADVIRRIVRVAVPDRILLFGSTARSEAGPDSDLDLLVIKAGQYHRGRLTGEIYRHLVGAGRAVDVVVVTPEDVERYRDSFALVIAPALRDGRVVSAA